MAKSRIMSENARLLEAVLYIENESLTVERLVELTQMNSIEVKAALKEIDEMSKDLNRGLTLINEDDSYSLAPSADLYERLKKSYGRKVDRRLKRASLETLSIIAYSQPITRKEIDKIRGVSSDSIVRLLREKEYIKVVGRADIPGHPCLYGTSRKFLVEFNLQSIADLPKLSQIDEFRFKKEEEEEEDDERDE